MYYAKFDSPFCEIILGSDGSVLTEVTPAFKATLASNAVFHPDLPVLQMAQEFLYQYFSGKAPSPHEIPLVAPATVFQAAVRRCMQQIPYGHSATYGQIAREISHLSGNKRMSAQAVGGAVGRNPVAIIVPCHRVLGAGGSLTGFGWGLDIKQKLLDLENIPYKV